MFLFLGALFLSPLIALFCALLTLTLFPAAIAVKLRGRLRHGRTPPFLAWAFAIGVGAVSGSTFAVLAFVIVPLGILAEPFVLLGLRLEPPRFLRRRLVERWKTRQDEVISARWRPKAKLRTAVGVQDALR